MLEFNCISRKCFVHFETDSILCKFLLLFFSCPKSQLCESTKLRIQIHKITNYGNNGIVILTLQSISSKVLYTASLHDRLPANSI